MSWSSEGSDSETTCPMTQSETDQSETTVLLSKKPPLREKDQNEIPDEAKTAKMTILGMIAVAVGTGFINTGGCLVAVIGGSALQIMMGRFIVQGILAIAWWVIRKPPHNNYCYGDPGARMNIWCRGGMYFLLTYGWYRGLELVPIGDAEAIIFIAPLMIVLIARFWLKEELSVVFPGTFLLTIAGIICVCQPEFIFHGKAGAEPVSPAGIVFLIIMALAWAGTSILVRTAQSAHWTQIQIVSAFQGACLWTPMLILVNRYWFKSDLIAGGEWNMNPDGRYIGLVCFCAVCGFMGITLNVIGYQLGDASKVAWMEYLDLIFAFIFQYAVFGDVPNLWEWIGGALLLSTCVLHLGEEVWKYKRASKDMKSVEGTQGVTGNTTEIANGIN